PSPPDTHPLSLHDALPISGDGAEAAGHALVVPFGGRWSYVAFQARQKLALVFIPVLLLIVQKEFQRMLPESMKNWQAVVSIAGRDRKSTRLNSSHGSISYA